jgi:uncharacterized protein YdcH (DUF465 family)
MSPTEEQCNNHREKIMEKTEKCFNNLQQSMEKTNEKIFEKLDELGKNFVELNANFQNVYKTQINVLKEQQIDKKDILMNKIWIASIAGALGLISILFPYFVSRYFENILDREKVEVIVREVIEKEYHKPTNL